MIAKTFILAKTFRAWERKILRRVKSLPDHGRPPVNTAGLIALAFAEGATGWCRRR